ncbi:hypothetical protein B0T26DRAFT_330681 [Lasiosphaeria miniovina]|uniref:Uncharacterized protein n=1 Tax=Lasiosphaeria miniovina TaxID=1954250 RepID=A0AA40DVZ7_9PEZI|nr:uncharacterized protein B0T26DRAFT_330681 [Lasiosphaeria miniovina]KAK0718414.1 hypothetical protein B0T26DRAFT_330681 [Lasiosphaeria miniovina]
MAATDTQTQTEDANGTPNKPKKGGTSHERRRRTGKPVGWMMCSSHAAAHGPRWGGGRGGAQQTDCRHSADSLSLALRPLACGLLTRSPTSWALGGQDLGERRAVGCGLPVLGKDSPPTHTQEGAAGGWAEAEKARIGRQAQANPPPSCSIQGPFLISDMRGRQAVRPCSTMPNRWLFVPLVHAPQSHKGTPLRSRDCVLSPAQLPVEEVQAPFVMATSVLYKNRLVGLGATFGRSIKWRSFGRGRPCHGDGEDFRNRVYAPPVSPAGNEFGIGMDGMTGRRLWASLD